MDGNALGKALAYAAGDLRDWPKQCAWCGSEDLTSDPLRDLIRCDACQRLTSEEVAYDDRVRRARTDVLG